MTSEIDMQTRLRLGEAREAVELNIEQASVLEKRHRENEKAISMLPKGPHRPVLMCLGKEAFISLSTVKVRDALVRENERIWEETDDLQRQITKGSRELEEMEESVRNEKSTKPTNR